MSELKQELKVALIEALNLQMDATAIEDTQPLFGDAGLGLDSIDALEIIVLLNKKYNVKLDKPEDGQKVFASVQTIADFIECKRV
jgi:acyl carrier protein